MRRRPRAVPRSSTSGAVAPDASDSVMSGGGVGAGHGPVVVVDDDNFFELTAGTYTVVDFWAPWCGPCRTFAPIFAEAAGAHTGPVRFGACNVDASPRTASLLAIRSVPTLVVFGPDGSEVGRRSGALPRRALDELVGRLGTVPEA